MSTRIIGWVLFLAAAGSARAQSEFIEEGIKKPVQGRIHVRFLGGEFPEKTVSWLEKFNLVADLKKDEKKVSVNFAFKGTYSDLQTLETNLGVEAVITNLFRLTIKYTFTEDVVKKAGKKFFTDAILKQPGVVRAHCDFIKSQVHFYGDLDKMNPEIAVQIFKQMGFGATIDNPAWHEVKVEGKSDGAKKIEERLLKIKGVLRAWVDANGKRVRVLAFASVKESELKEAVAAPE